MNQIEPLLSIIVPVYNAELYLKRCVRSIQNQLWKNFELILVDDGSSDQSGILCDQLSKEDRRIRVIHKKNGGAASARNVGLDIASGDYIGFVDSDDWISQEMYERLFDLMRKFEADIACCGIRYLSIDNRTERYINNNLDDFMVLDTEQALVEYLKYKNISSGVVDKLYRKFVFEKNRFHEGITHEDALIVPRCISCAKKIVYSAEPMYQCFLSPDSVSRRSFSLNRFDRIYVWKLNVDFFAQYHPEVLQTAKVLLVYAYLDVIHEAGKDKKYIKERIRAKNELDKFLHDNSDLRFNINTQLKLKAYNIGLSFYDLVCNINDFICRRINT